METKIEPQSPIKPPAQLPILAQKDKILQAIADHPVIIICGETGSGKSTQLPQLCLAAGRGGKKRIACTQPRRIAAITIARRIAEERNEKIGETIGYKIRFEEKLSRQSVIKVMTDGVLLAETQHDPLLLQYDTIIVDEAHERSVNIDFILGILRSVLKRRKDLKVIITSATLDTAKFSQAFQQAPVIHVSGRLYQVSVLYQALDKDMEDQGETTYIDAAVNAVEYLLRKEDHGDILVFLPTEQDIRECLDLLKGKHDRNILFLPLFSRLAWPDQKKVFDLSPGRKVILATNIAETSLTIPRVRFVVDTGLARILSYNPSSGTTSLPITAISRSSADQRKGRCGRVQNGLCIRLYSEADYAARSEFNLPEILRSNLAGIILKMLSLNMGDIHNFPFIDKPSPKAIKNGFDLLSELGAIAKNTSRTKSRGPYMLTDKGKWMAMLPIDPRVARMIIEGLQEKCLREIIIIASALSVQDPRERPAEKEKQAGDLHRLLQHPHSDFLTFLNIWRLYETNKALLQSQNKMRKFCKTQFLSYRRMREWLDIYQQIHDILQQDTLFRDNLRQQEQDAPTAESSPPSAWNPQHNFYAAIHRAVLSGYLSHIAQKKEKMVFKAMGGRNVFLFPGSALFQKSGPWIVAAEYVETTKLYARTAAQINPDWLEKLGAHLCKRTYFDPHWSKTKGEAMAFMQVSLFGLIIVARRLVAYGKIDPALSRQLFIEALVNGDVARPLPFLTYNRQLIEKIKDYEAKMRRADLLANGEKQYGFYHHRLPQITSMKALQNFLAERGADDLLRMTEDDLLEREIDGEAIKKNYPDAIQADGITFALAYAFAPGSPRDGVTLKVPMNAINHIPSHVANMAAPGLQEEIIYHLLKTLPKEYRKQLQPLREKIPLILRETPPKTENFFLDLQSCVKNLWGINIPLSAWRQEKLPPHLRTRYEIIDAAGNVLSANRDIAALQNHISGQQENRAWAEAQQKWEKGNIFSFEPDELPERIPLTANNRLEGYAFPALTDDHDACAIRLFRDHGEAEAAHRQGMLRCYSLQITDRIKQLRKNITSHPHLHLWLKQLPDAPVRVQSIIDAAIAGVYDLTARTKTTCQKSLSQGGELFFPYAADLLGEITKIMNAWQATRQMIGKLQNRNKTRPEILSYLRERENDLFSLVPPLFPLSLPREDFPNLIRSMQTLCIRTERGVLDLPKDQTKEKNITEFMQSHLSLSQSISLRTSPAKKEAIVQLAQMIRELQISVFAPELKTTITISPKRLREKITEIEKME